MPRPSLRSRLPYIYPGAGEYMTLRIDFCPGDFSYGSTTSSGIDDYELRELPWPGAGQNCTNNVNDCVSDDKSSGLYKGDKYVFCDIMIAVKSGCEADFGDDLVKLRRVDADGTMGGAVVNKCKPAPTATSGGSPLNEGSITLPLKCVAKMRSNTIWSASY